MGNYSQLLQEKGTACNKKKQEADGLCNRITNQYSKTSSYFDKLA